MIIEGTIAEGVAETLLPGGESVVRIEGSTLLVANAVPGDRLKLRVAGRRRGVFRGEIIEVLEPATDRIAAPCALADRCGGCALQYLSGERQAAVKSAWVADAFARVMGDECIWMPVQFQAGRCRRRVRWFKGVDNEGPFLGFYAPASHQPVRQNHCLVASEELNLLRRIIEESLISDHLNAVQALQLSDGIHVILEADSAPDPVEVSGIDDMRLQWWWRDKQGITRPLKKPVVAFHDQLPAGDHDVALTVGPEGFVQGQLEGNRELITQIIDWAGPVRRVADLFCGIGNLCLPLAAATGAQVAGAELNEASVRAASANARELAVSASFEVANLFEAFEMEPYIAADLLILDPPRRGAKRICRNIDRLMPAKIIMISCDPAAGARDGALLTEHGYRLKALRALDLFPGAGHVEAMSLWER